VSGLARTHSSRVDSPRASLPRVQALRLALPVRLLAATRGVMGFFLPVLWCSGRSLPSARGLESQ